MQEEAERAKSSKDDKLARLQLELEKCAKELAQKQHQIHQMQSGGDIMGRDLARQQRRPRLPRRRQKVIRLRRRTGRHGGPAAGGERREAESGASDGARRQEASRRARSRRRPRAAAAKWESEVSQRRNEVEMMQEELEACLEVERQERRKAEELYEIAKEEKGANRRREAEEISTLEERLVEATAAAEEIRAGIEERDQLLRDGDAVLEAKEAELDEAAPAHALSLQRELDELRAEQERMRAERDAGSPPRPSEEENARNKEALILQVRERGAGASRAAGD